MHKPESVPENKKHTIWGDFQIRMDLLMSRTKPDLVIINT